jgi:hypothetical protein
MLRIQYVELCLHGKVVIQGVILTLPLLRFKRDLCSKIVYIKTQSFVSFVYAIRSRGSVVRRLQAAFHFI